MSNLQTEPSPLPYATPAPPQVSRQRAVYYVGAVIGLLLFAGGMGITVGGLMVAFDFDEDAAVPVGFGLGSAILGFGILLLVLWFRIRHLLNRST